MLVDTANWKNASSEDCWRGFKCKRKDAVDELGVADEDCACGKFRAHNSTDFLVFFFLLNAFLDTMSEGKVFEKQM